MSDASSSSTYQQNQIGTSSGQRAKLRLKKEKSNTVASLIITLQRRRQLTKITPQRSK